MKKLIALFTLIAFTVPVLANATPVDDALKSKILLYGNTDNPQTLDPGLATGVVEGSILLGLFEGLTTYKMADASVLPGVAESWTASKDGMVYTFKLRKNAKWSNGDPVTANDFAYAWERVINPSFGSEYAYILHCIKNAKEYTAGKVKDFKQVGVKVKDDYTLEVTLAYPAPYFLNIVQHMSTFPVHKPTIEKHGGQFERNSPWTKPENIVSNGPFVLKSNKLNEKIIVEKSATYWAKDKIKLNGIHYFPVADQQTADRMFRSGALHYIDELNPSKVAKYQKESYGPLSVTPYLGTYYYTYNTKKPPLDNPKVRKAISMAIDREKIVKYVSKGGEIAWGALTPPNTGGYTTKSQVKFDPEGAKKLLAEAGYPDGKGLPSIDMKFNTSEKHKVIALAIQQMIKKNLGIDITLTNVDWKVYLDDRKKGDFLITRNGWIGDYNDASNFLEMYITGGSHNQSGWGNAQYDAYLDQAARETDPAKRNELFAKAEAILVDESPIIPIFVYTSTALVSPDLQNWHQNIIVKHPFQGIDLVRK